MPNVTTTLYLSDEVYNKDFLPKKKEIMEKMRSHIRDQLGVKVRDQN